MTTTSTTSIKCISKGFVSVYQTPCGFIELVKDGNVILVRWETRSEYLWDKDYISIETGKSKSALAREIARGLGWINY